MFLKNELKDKTIIAAGEATHGTGNFYEFKDRLFRFLVKEMGVRAIAIESPMTSCQEINRYILTGEGDIKTIIEDGVFAIYSTEELLSLVEWMKEYNDTVDNDKKVRFYGFDVQDKGSIFTSMENFYKK